MLADSGLWYQIQKIIPGQYWYYIIIGGAVLAALGGVWVWLRKKDGGG